MNAKADILFISHGGGPLPLLGDPDHREMVDYLRQTAAGLAKPSAILVISAHWEERVPTITSGANPSLIYDYAGFPPQSYEIGYPCAGEPQLAQQVYQSIEDAGFSPQLDDQRGFDHGLFVPLKLMYPEADIPCVQLSLVNSLNAETHLDIGRALRSLEYQNLLVVGSGFSFHNLRAFFAPDTPDIEARNLAFEGWLRETCVNPDIDETERARRLAHWESAPFARFCHPREEHLLPLHVCYGLAERACDDYILAKILKKKSGMFYWSRMDK